MGKSSNSHNKKRSNKSFKVRVTGKRKSRKHISKKLQRRRDASPSISDYSDSVSSDSVLPSSSEDSYRSRKSRSSKRKDEKGRRKMAKTKMAKTKRRSRRYESSDDTHRGRKRKRAKRKSEKEAREKPYKTKRPRKEKSVSSMSDGSLSCSTCNGVSVSSDDKEHERHRGREERKGKEKRPERGRSESEEGDRYRARSCSSCSFSSESGDQWTEVNYVGKINSRRLKSVIAVIEEADEVRESCHNDSKEEIVDDHDYPCRSNDSNDGGNKRESDHHSPLTSKEKVGIDDIEVDKVADSSITEPKRDQSHKNSDQFVRSGRDFYGAGTSESVEKKTSETSGTSLDGDDLEAILRKRALENLRKFRGEVQSSAKASNQKIRIDTDDIQPPIKSHELGQGKSIIINAGEGGNFDKISNPEGNNLTKERRKSVACSSEKGKDQNGVKGESVPLQYHSSCASEKVMDAENNGEKVTVSASYVSKNLGYKKKLVVTDNAIDMLPSDPVHNSNDNVKNIRTLCSASQKPKEQDEVKVHFQVEPKQTSGPDKLHHTMCPPTGGNVDQNAADKTSDAIQSTSTSGIDVDKSGVSAISIPSSESTPGENSSNNLQGEANQGSQFQQKTMSVMRGGEMVQVNYKVYIPKKTPALARRKLKR